MLTALALELEQRKGFLQNEPIQSIYFGGGTPSIVHPFEIQRLIDVICKDFPVNREAEITMEANPENLTNAYLKDLQATEINRLSIGLQTFDSDTLKFLNRVHSAEDGKSAVKRSMDFGFEAISADLIFGIPPEKSTLDRYKKDVNELLQLDVPHVSLYGLTIEPRTAFGNWASKGKFQEVSADVQAEAFHWGSQYLRSAGYEHYEVSNFAKPTCRSRHNSSYWMGDPYLGIGPAAHSFDGTVRVINEANNSKYLLASDFTDIQSVEELSLEDRFHEYLITRLRTDLGIDLEHIRVAFHKTMAKTELIEQLVENKQATYTGSKFTLTAKGMVLADEVALAFSS